MKQKDKRELVISLGFICELFLFLITGFLVAYFSWLAIPSFIAGVIVAVAVGNRIARNEVLNYIEKNNNDRQKKESELQTEGI